MVTARLTNILEIIELLRKIRIKSDNRCRSDFRRCGEVADNIRDAFCGSVGGSVCEPR